MAGHSKWHNIRLRKGKQDAERGKIFTKLAKEIIVAAKEGGSNPDANLRLRLAIQKAKEGSMPADNIKRAIQRGAGEVDGANYEEIIYEGYGPLSVAVMVKCLTDNRNRTVSEVRHAFSKHGGNMSDSGSVGWQFKAIGLITIAKETIDEEKLFEIALDAGAEDVRAEEDNYEVETSVEAFGSVRMKIDEAGIKINTAELTMVPQNTVKVETAAEAEKILRLMDALEELDDVQDVYANFDIPDEIMNKLE